MPLPIIFIHGGPSSYLACSITQARQSNPKSEIYLLGDRSNRGLIHAKHILSADYSEGARQFHKLYKHRSTNSVEYERYCFQRWFILYEFLEKRGIDACLYLDSDVLLFSDATIEAQRFAEYDLTPSRTCPYCMFINSRETLRKFCSFMLECYSNPNLFERLEKHYMNLQARNEPGGVCDMTVFGLYEELGLARMADLYQVRDGKAYNPQMSDCGGFVMKDGIKKIFWSKNGEPFGRLAASGEPVIFLAMHFQGSTKQYMSQHMRFGSLRLRWAYKWNRLVLERRNSLSKLVRRIPLLRSALG